MGLHELHLYPLTQGKLKQTISALTGTQAGQDLLSVHTASLWTPQTVKWGIEGEPTQKSWPNCPADVCVCWVSFISIEEAALFFFLMWFLPTFPQLKWEGSLFTGAMRSTGEGGAISQVENPISCHGCGNTGASQIPSEQSTTAQMNLKWVNAPSTGIDSETNRSMSTSTSCIPETALGGNVRSQLQHIQGGSFPWWWAQMEGLEFYVCSFWLSAQLCPACGTPGWASSLWEGGVSGGGLNTVGWSWGCRRLPRPGRLMGLWKAHFRPLIEIISYVIRFY